MPNMTALDQMIDVLDSQVENRDRAKRDGWDRCTYTLTREEDGGTKVSIEDQQVAFIFCAQGNLVGMYNWKW